MRRESFRTENGFRVELAEEESGAGEIRVYDERDEGAPLFYARRYEAGGGIRGGGFAAAEKQAAAFGRKA